MRETLYADEACTGTAPIRSPPDIGGRNGSATFAVTVTTTVAPADGHSAPRGASDVDLDGVRIHLVLRDRGPHGGVGASGRIRPVRRRAHGPGHVPRGRLDSEHLLLDRTEGDHEVQERNQQDHAQSDELHGCGPCLAGVPQPTSLREW